MSILQTGNTIADQMDLLREQVKMLAGEVALCTSSLKRLSEQAASKPEDLELQVSYYLIWSSEDWNTICVDYQKLSGLFW